jgi:hypothetical protein
MREDNHTTAMSLWRLKPSAARSQEMICASALPLPKPLRLIGFAAAAKSKNLARSKACLSNDHLNIREIFVRILYGIGWQHRRSPALFASRKRGSEGPQARKKRGLARQLKSKRGGPSQRPRQPKQALTAIEQAFSMKARRERGSLNDQWQPYAPRLIAAALRVGAQTRYPE